ncbi:PAP1 protein [Gonium pectorale]|uniref:PAP1 protein n=1 Tax=Gonium pectorale TaxID=33097 RepID=A0A150GQX2_GONPE|nr:PAP1 protein [Gonium pectorale]|eukprot:KXZ52138.1 PAP1 protein [Gonium pectorale]
MGTQAFRTDFALDEEEDRFFISGVEKAERSRHTYEHQARKKKVIVGVAIGVGSVALVALILGLACMPPQFVISTGDNFYPSGLNSAEDPQFSVSFSRVYSGPGLQVPWYAVMGNHDYGDNVDVNLLSEGTCLQAPASPAECAGKCCISPWWQITPELAARDTRWNATMGGVVTRRFPLQAGEDGRNRSLDILFMDTVPLIYQYQDRPWSSFLYGFKSQDADAIRASLQRQLNESYAGGNGSSWRLVVGHHPVRSYGRHCTQPDSNECEDMAFMRPLLQRFRVAAYVNGHDHDQQLIKSPSDPVHYIVSGAGSDTRPGEFDGLDPELRSQDALFLSDTQGFVAVVVSGNSMRVHYYTTDMSGPAYTRVIMQPSW